MTDITKGDHAVFAQKLDFLMRLTKTSNTSMGYAVSLDPSYVSRLRSGVRPLPRNSGYLPSMTLYLARRITKPEQREVLCRVMREEALPGETKEMSDLLYAWLLDDSENPLDIAVRDQNTASGPRSADRSASGTAAEYPEVRDGTAFRGSDGEEEAMRLLLTQAAESSAAKTIYIYSDNVPTWMLGDAEQTALWQDLFRRAVAQGCRLVVVLSPNLSSHETQSASNIWVPFCLAGAADVYHCPRMRDGLFDHAFFIAAGTAAVVSVCAGGSGRDYLSFYYTRPETVRYYEQLFRSFLANCRPLMQVSSAEDPQDLLNLLHIMTSPENNSFYLSKGPGLFTVPEKVFASLERRTGMQLQGRLPDFENQLKTQLANRTVEDQFLLPDPVDVRMGRIPVPMNRMIGCPGVTYTAEEFRWHIAHIMELIRTCDNYHPYLSYQLDYPCDIFLKDNELLILAGREDASQCLYLTRDLPGSCREYLMVCHAAARRLSRQEILARLQEYAEQL